MKKCDQRGNYKRICLNRPGSKSIANNESLRKSPIRLKAMELGSSKQQKQKLPLYGKQTQDTSRSTMIYGNINVQNEISGNNYTGNPFVLEGPILLPFIEAVMVD